MKSDKKTALRSSEQSSEPPKIYQFVCLTSPREETRKLEKQDGLSILIDDDDLGRLCIVRFRPAERSGPPYGEFRQGCAVFRQLPSRNRRGSDASGRRQRHESEAAQGFGQELHQVR